MKRILLGNEAIARGAFEAGVRVICAYPGTPSTEIAENAGKYPEMHVSWAPNEKVALEAACGASFAGGRAMCCMKHVGLNVAADPLFTASYTGIRAGLVVVVADDPGMHSSQNEQDTRLIARAAHVPVIEPSDSQECKDFVALGFTISEKYDTPVILRITTRVAHARSLVEEKGREEAPLMEYQKDIMKYVMMPGMAKKRHVAVEAREKKLSEDANDMAINRVEKRGTDIGVVCSGITYEYVRDALPEASVLKLGLVYPLPFDLIGNFLKGVDRPIVMEELEPFIEEQIKARGMTVGGKKSIQGELSVQRIKQDILGLPMINEETPDIPARPPVMCPGCPHRPVFALLKKKNLHVMGDIGCYTLGALPPLGALDACLCMGASIGMASGSARARGEEFGRETVAIIGDSTFLHSGITGLMDAVYNNDKTTVIIADNSITGMTGHQDHAGTGRNLRGEKAPAVDIETICRAVGVVDIQVVDPIAQPKELEKALSHALEFDGVSVLITRRPCALIIKEKQPVRVVDAEKCRACGTCLRFACPAIENHGGRPLIQPSQCNGCSLCETVCPFGAIHPINGEEVGK